MIRLRPALAGSVAWLVGAATAVGVGLVALSLVGVGPSEEPLQPLSPEAVRLAAPEAPVPATSAAPVQPTHTPKVRTAASPSPSNADRLLTSRGGTVVARCRPDGGVYLVYWTPAQGYQVDNVRRGPAASTSVTFEGRGREERIVVTCVDSVPHSSVRTDD